MTSEAPIRYHGLLHVFSETSTRDVSIDDVGSKAYNLMRMTEAGLPVPPGYVLSTALCRAYYDAGERLTDDVIDIVADGIRQLELTTGSGFGADRRPLLVAVRSGAAASMPGMLDTILTIGLTDATLPALLRSTGDPVFVWDSYRRLIQSYGEVVDGCDPARFDEVLNAATREHGVPAVNELDVAALKLVVDNLRDVYRSAAGRPFPQDPIEQLMGAVEAVLRSWNAPRARDYRAVAGLTGLRGTAVTIQTMVFGNLGVTSGSGVGFTRDPATGENRPYIDFLLNAQGEDVVSGRRNAGGSDQSIAAVPNLLRELSAARRKLESLFKDVQDFEFTVQEGRVWLLQTRAAQRTDWAALHIACDLVDEGLIDTATAAHRLADIDLDAVSRINLAANGQASPIGRGTPAGNGVVTGRAALSRAAAERLAEQGQTIVLVRAEASTDDIAGLALCRGLLTATGARTSHAVVVARQLGVVGVIGCTDLVVDEDRHCFTIGSTQISEDEPITVDGTHGVIYPGELEVCIERPAELIARVRSWQATQQR